MPTSQDQKSKLTPTGNDIPKASDIKAADGTSRLPDQGAPVKDERTYAQLFDAELLAGNLDQHKTAKAVNEHLGSLKGGSNCQYFVGEFAHAYVHNGKAWVKRDAAWLTANPYVVQTRAPRASGVLDDATLAGHKAVVAAYPTLPEAMRTPFKPAYDMAVKAVAEHNKAVAEQAILQARIQAREEAATYLRITLRQIETAGKAWTLEAVKAIIDSIAK